MHSKEENILIFCRHLNDVGLLSKIRPENAASYIIASDDIRIKDNVAAYPWVKEVCWMEQSESIHGVANDVKSIVQIINSWLKTLSNNSKIASLLFWVPYVEGGFTVQRIQDALLLINSYQYLFEKYRCKKIIILKNIHHWDDDVLIQAAICNNLSVKTVSRVHLDQVLPKMMSTINLIGREPFYIANTLLVKIRNILGSKNKNKYHKEIDIQLCSESAKHLAHTIAIMKSLKIKGYDPVALCWTTYGAVKIIKKELLNVEELENYVPLNTILISIFKTLQLLYKAYRRKKSFITLKELKYRSIPLGVLLWPSVVFFILAEIGQMYRLMVASEKYYKIHNPVAVRFWTTIFPEAIIAYSSLVLRNGKKTSIFYQPGYPYDWDDPYEHRAIPVDLELAMSEKHKKILEKDNFTSKQISVVGHEKFDTIDNFMASYTKHDSRSFLKIPDSYDYYILYDPCYISRGYFSVKEQVQMTDCLLRISKNHLNIALIIKPHPRHHAGILEHQISSFSQSNVFLIDKRLLPHHCLNSADVIITKFSVIGTEGMYFRKPIISTIFDNEMKFRAYGNAAHYVYNVEELEKLLLSLINDKEFMEKWSSLTMSRVEEFLAENFLITEKLPAEFAADSIHNFLINDLPSH